MKYYITTAIDYPSGSPHLGHAYEKIAADVIARWNRLNGNDVFFLTGTDEHGLKIQRAAEKSKKTPKKFVDEMSIQFKKLCKDLNISNDFFIRTTDKKHEKVVKKIYDLLKKKGDIYKGEYEGLYCVDCETFYTETQSIENNCPIHKRPLEKLKEESYFFKMSKYQDKMLKHIENNPDYILPKFKRNEIINRIKEGVKDISISRTSFKWGIPLPDDSKHIFYVWLDALTNYLSGIDYPKSKYKKYWPADIHLIGSDILWHHTMIWNSILMSAGLKLPKTVFVHGFVNIGGEKLSKARNIKVDPTDLIKKYGTDKIRYYLMREIPFGQDGNFSEEHMIKRTNTELADSLGNLLNRVVVMCEKYFNSKIPNSTEDKLLSSKFNFKKIYDLMKKYELHNALSEIFSFIDECNKYINDKAPWTLAKNNKQKELEKVIYNLTEALRIISQLIYSFMPETSEKIDNQLGFKHRDEFNLKWGNVKSKGVNKGETLFRKIENG